MTKSIAVPLVLALFTALPAVAQGMMPGAGMGAMIVDSNDDGVVSADEAAAHWEARFTMMDGDGDDAVSEDEFLDMGAQGWGGGRMPLARMMQNRTERFAALDADGDKTVTRAEFMASGEAAMKAADADGDGKVTVWEFRAVNRPF